MASQAEPDQRVVRLARARADGRWGVARDGGTGAPAARLSLAMRTTASSACAAIVAFPAPAVAPPQSVKIWRRPRLSARSSRAIMCSMLGRPLPSFQRRSVSWWTSRRRAISAHYSPDSSLNRSSRSGKSGGPGRSLCNWWMRCLGMESPVLPQDGCALSPTAMPRW